MMRKFTPAMVTGVVSLPRSTGRELRGYVKNTPPRRPAEKATLEAAAKRRSSKDSRDGEGHPVIVLHMVSSVPRQSSTFWNLGSERQRFLRPLIVIWMSVTRSQLMVLSGPVQEQSTLCMGRSSLHSEKVCQWTKTQSGYSVGSNNFSHCYTHIT